MHIFFDESIHDRGGFILGAFVVAEADPGPLVAEAIRGVGLKPRQDEYKSRHPHGGDQRYVSLRVSFYSILRGMHIAVFVAPVADRRSFSHDALAALAHVLCENPVTTPIVACFDQGVLPGGDSLGRLVGDVGLPASVVIDPSCDSRLVEGVQLADLVAHTCATMLLADLGLLAKTVKAGPNSGYDEDMDMPLEFELWASLRYQFFSRRLTDPTLADAAASGLVDSSGALYVSPRCSAALREAAEGRFARMYLGCIH